MMRFSGSKPIVVHFQVRPDPKEFDEQLQVIGAELRLSVGILEVSLLITGTLLWGFGDLVNF